jgi:hypothetical protein
MTFAPGEVVVILDVEAHVDTERVSDMPMNERMIRCGTAP